MKDEDFFEKLCEEVGPRTLLPKTKLQTLFSLARQAEPLSGDFAEAGVCQGGSARLIAMACPGKIVRLFDTFGGLPYSNPNVDVHSVGDFKADLDEVTRYLSDCPNVTFHPGIFPESAAAFSTAIFSFVHIDMDQYQSTKSAIDFFYTRMTPGGLMIFDDYEWAGCPGVKKALDEFPVDVIPLGNCQALIQR